MAQAEGDVLFDGEMREERVVLEDQADPALLRRGDGGGRGNDGAVQRDGAAVGGFEPGDEAQQGGLATAALADQREQLSFRQLERHVLDRRLVAAAVALGEILDVEADHGFWRSRRVSGIKPMRLTSTMKSPGTEASGMRDSPVRR